MPGRKNAMLSIMEMERGKVEEKEEEEKEKKEEEKEKEEDNGGRLMRLLGAWLDGRKYGTRCWSPDQLICWSPGRRFHWPRAGHLRFFSLYYYIFISQFLLTHYCRGR